MAEAAERRGKDPLEFAFDLLPSERMGVSMISFSQSEEVVARVMREPYVNVCTDGLLGGRPHPRAYGTYPRILGRYVREQQVLTLEEAVRKMTSQAADAMHLPDRGRIAPGQAGDLVAFDADKVIDRATFADPLQSPSGIVHVVVGGVAVVADSRPTRRAARACGACYNRRVSGAPDQLFGEIVRLHNSRTPCVLATVVRTAGSTPRKASARMIVLARRAHRRHHRRRPHREGGGRRGAGAARRGHAARAKLLRYHLTHELAMCCGGEMEVFVEPLDSGAAARSCAAAATSRTRWCRWPRRSASRRSSIEEAEEMATRARFPDAARIVDSFDPRDWKDLPLDAGTYVVIVTRDHAQDQALLEALRRPRARRTSGSSARGARSRCSSGGSAPRGVERRAASSGCTRRSGSTSAPRRRRRSPSPSSRELIQARAARRTSNDLRRVVLAAGASTRMGEPKALLRDPDGRTYLDAIADTARAGGCERGGGGARAAARRRDPQTARSPPGAARAPGIRRPSAACSRRCRRGSTRCRAG